MTETKPKLGQAVIYRSLTGDYSRAAIVVGTQEEHGDDAVRLRSIEVEGEEGEMVHDEVPALESATHVHLRVFSLTSPGADYPEFNVAKHTGRGEQAPGTWAESEATR